MSSLSSRAAVLPVRPTWNTIQGRRARRQPGWRSGRGQGGKPMLRVETLSPALARRLAADPQFLLRPEEVWTTLDAQEAEEADLSQLEAPKEPPKLPAPSDTQTRRADD